MSLSSEIVVSLGDYPIVITRECAYSDDDAGCARLVLEEGPLPEVVAGLVREDLGLRPVGLSLEGQGFALQDQVETVPDFSLLDDGLILSVVISPECISDLRPLVGVHLLEYGYRRQELLIFKAFLCGGILHDVIERVPVQLPHDALAPRSDRGSSRRVIQEGQLPEALAGLVLSQLNPFPGAVEGALLHDEEAIALVALPDEHLAL